MRKHGHVVAKKFQGNGYVGDYYVLGSKRSQFHYVALSNLETFALQKSFLFNNILTKYPNLH